MSWYWNNWSRHHNHTQRTSQGILHFRFSTRNYRFWFPPRWPMPTKSKIISPQNKFRISKKWRCEIHFKRKCRTLALILHRRQCSLTLRRPWLHFYWQRSTQDEAFHYTHRCVCIFRYQIQGPARQLQPVAVCNNQSKERRKHTYRLRMHSPRKLWSKSWNLTPEVYRKRVDLRDSVQTNLSPPV